MNQGREGKCARKCCWSPQGVCGKQGNCACHNQHFFEAQRVERLAKLHNVTVMEEFRRQSLKRKGA